jgi:hypothetical protein
MRTAVPGSTWIYAFPSTNYSPVRAHPRVHHLDLHAYAQYLQHELKLTLKEWFRSLARKEPHRQRKREFRSKLD